MAIGGILHLHAKVDSSGLQVLLSPLPELRSRLELRRLGPSSELSMVSPRGRGR